MIQIKVKHLSEGSVTPSKNHSSDAGYDFFMPVDVDKRVIFPGERVKIDTKIALEIPQGYYLQIKSRSGLSAKHKIDACAGVIDCSYRGSVVIVLHNSSKFTEYEVNPGDKIAQGVLLKIPVSEMIVVDELDETERGNNGFGSSGR